MTIRTNWPKVINWIEFVFSVGEGQRIRVMYANESLAKSSIGRLEVKAAYNADGAMVEYARLACPWVALVSIHTNSLSCPFEILVSGFQFIGKKAFTRSANDCNCLSEFTEPFGGNGPFAVGEQITKRRLKNDCLKRQIGPPSFQKSIETSTLASTARLQHSFRGREPAVATNRLNKATAPIAHFVPCALVAIDECGSEIIFEAHTHVAFWRLTKKLSCGAA